VQIVDALPEDAVLVDGSNIVDYQGGGGSDTFTYTMKINGPVGVVGLPEPTLYLDTIKITLNGASPKLQVLMLNAVW
jgi:hypothetical protein